jgi:hypothetical protein
MYDMNDFDHNENKVVLTSIEVELRISFSDDSSVKRAILTLSCADIEPNVSTVDSYYEIAKEVFQAQLVTQYKFSVFGIIAYLMFKDYELAKDQYDRIEYHLMMAKLRHV